MRRTITGVAAGLGVGTRRDPDAPPGSVPRTIQIRGHHVLTAEASLLCDLREARALINQKVRTNLIKVRYQAG
jgi:hypothetical protein